MPAGNAPAALPAEAASDGASYLRLPTTTEPMESSESAIASSADQRAAIHGQCQAQRQDQEGTGREQHANCQPAILAGSGNSSISNGTNTPTTPAAAPLPRIPIR
jgi:hypothetical protein